MFSGSIFVWAIARHPAEKKWPEKRTVGQVGPAENVVFCPHAAKSRLLTPILVFLSRPPRAIAALPSLSHICKRNQVSSCPGGLAAPIHVGVQMCSKVRVLRGWWPNGTHDTRGVGRVIEKKISRGFWPHLGGWI